jgi:signal transduction histidine kinase
VVDFAVRTSLGLVKGYVYALGQNQLMDDHHRARYVRIIEEEIDHLAKIIEDMLDVRRMESGRYELNWDAVDIRECVRVVECQCEEEALRRRIEVVVRMPETMEPLYLPREAISRVMLNLLLNGIHHTLHNGKVWLTVEDHDLYIEISVKDNGVGIPESEIPYIFDKFYRGRNSASSNLMGPGLGLTIVRTLVEAMGGKIHVGSAVGAGTDFRMVLPRQPVGVLDPNDTQAPKLPSAAPDAPATL